jgi:hypothetical protein
LIINTLVKNEPQAQIPLERTQQICSQSGQAAIEYVILLVCVAMGAVFVFQALPQALAAYTHGFYYVWSKPII